MFPPRLVALSVGWLVVLFGSASSGFGEGPQTLSGVGLPKWFRYYPAEHRVAIERTTVEMRDGVKLAVTFYKPADASAERRVPIVMNMVPYRKDDLFYAGDFGMYSYLAARGIACARIDIRGTGGSDGVLVPRDYSDAELSDLQQCIAKFAALPWCNGKIGMQGKSWAGFNALMMAMRKPPALKALLVAHASEDLYANDVHNWDGGWFRGRGGRWIASEAGEIGGAFFGEADEVVRAASEVIGVVHRIW